MSNLIARIEECMPNARILPLVEQGVGTSLPDATQKYTVSDETGEGFLIISSLGNPDLIRRAVNNIEAARLVAGSAATAILPPKKTGEIDGRSFAIWEREKPFPDSRLGRIKTRWLYASQILDWCLDFGANTMETATDIHNQFVVPLTAVKNDTKFPISMREDADWSLDRLSEWVPKQCAHHGDFWIGNVLLKDDSSLAIIDWAGAKIDGYPVIDMVRMMVSLGCSRRTKEHYLNRLSQTLSCGRSDLIIYVLAALGHLGANLEYFPDDLYHEMGVRVYSFMSSEVI